MEFIINHSMADVMISRKLSVIHNIKLFWVVNVWTNYWSK